MNKSVITTKLLNYVYSYFSAVEVYILSKNGSIYNRNTNYSDINIHINSQFIYIIASIPQALFFIRFENASLFQADPKLASSRR